MRKIKKEKTVILCTPDGEKREFTLSHAERLLDMGDALNGGWKIVENSNYYYDEENGIRLKSDKANIAETE